MLKLVVVKYKVLEGIATADVAYEVYGKTIEELFNSAAEAVTQTMVDVVTLKPVQKLKFKNQNSKLEELLHNFLNEIIYLKDAERLLFSKYKIKITRHYHLNADLWGEKIDPAKHHLRTDIKAVTRHKLAIIKSEDYYFAQIVLDI